MLRIDRGEKKNLEYPFKLIDRIINMDVHECTVLKNVSADEWCMINDNTSLYCLPPSILVECMVQTAGMLEEYRQMKKRRQIFLLGMNKVRMPKMIIPGMQLLFTASVMKMQKYRTRYHVDVRVDDICAAKGDLILQASAAYKEKASVKRQLKSLGLWEPWFFRISQWAVFVVFQMILKYWCGIACYGVERIENIKQCVFAPTHFSHLDFWSVLYNAPENLRKSTYVAAARDHFYKNPLKSVITRAGSYHNFPFDRKMLTPGGYRHLLRILSTGYSLLMFPQGTRSRDGKVKLFKPLLVMLAIECNVPVVPVLITGTHEAMPPGKFWIKKNKIKVYFGKPLLFDKIENMERRKMAGIARAMNKQVMESIEDLVRESIL